MSMSFVRDLAGDSLSKREEVGTEMGQALGARDRLVTIGRAVGFLAGVSIYC